MPYATENGTYSTDWTTSNYNYTNNTNICFYPGTDAQNLAYSSDSFQSYQQTSSSQVSNSSQDNNNSTNFEDPYVLKEEFLQHKQLINSKIEQIDYDIKQTKNDVTHLTSSMGNLSIQIATHDRLLAQQDHEIVELNVDINREMCVALLTVFKEQSGYAPVGRHLAILLRQLMNKTPAELPDKIISKFVYVLEARKILRPRSSTDRRWELDVEMAVKYGLLKRE